MDQYALGQVKGSLLVFGKLIIILFFPVCYHLNSIFQY